MKRLLLLTLACALGGCVSYRAGYAPDAPLAARRLPKEQRTAVVYSVSLKQDFVTEGTVFDALALKRMAGDALRASGLFSSVSYGNPGKGVYHVSFDFRVSGERPGDTAAGDCLSALTLMTFPVTEATSLDLRLRATRDGQPVFAATGVEQMRQTISLPLILASWYWNPASARRETAQAAVNEAVGQLAASFVPAKK